MHESDTDLVAWINEQRKKDSFPHVKVKASHSDTVVSAYRQALDDVMNTGPWLPPVDGTEVMVPLEDDALRDHPLQTYRRAIVGKIQRISRSLTQFKSGRLRPNAINR